MVLKVYDVLRALVVEFKSGIHSFGFHDAMFETTQYIVLEF